MKRFRIAVFGINDGILHAIKRAIDPRKAEIVLFFDNDKMKLGICYMDIPILEPSREIIETFSIDYIVVTALSAYESVENQLLSMGISRDKIQVFVADDLWKYCLGAVVNINTDFIKCIYFEPHKRLDIVAKYKEAYDRYSAVPVCKENTEKWYHKCNLIAHACGGNIDGRKVIYSNSKEALYYSMKKKFRVIECDLMRMNDELILAHDYERFYELEQEKYTRMTAEEVLVFLREQEMVSCLIDVKWDSYEEYAFLLNEVEKLIENITDNYKEKITLKKQIVIEVYDEETIKIARKKDFEMFFTQYRNPQGECFMDTVSLCHKYGIEAVGIPVEWFWDMRKFLNIITDKNIKLFVYSTDAIDEYSAMRKMNVTGVFTNFLTVSDIVTG